MDRFKAKTTHLISLFTFKLPSEEGPGSDYLRSISRQEESRREIAPRLCHKMFWVWISSVPYCLYIYIYITHKGQIYVAYQNFFIIYIVHAHTHTGRWLFRLGLLAKPALLFLVYHMWCCIVFFLIFLFLGKPRISRQKMCLHSPQKKLIHFFFCW